MLWRAKMVKLTIKISKMLHDVEDNNNRERPVNNEAERQYLVAVLLNKACILIHFAGISQDVSHLVNLVQTLLVLRHF